MPDLARRRFDAAVAYGLRVEGAAGDAQRHAEARAEIADEGLVAVGLRAAKMMIDVRGCQLEGS